MTLPPLPAASSSPATAAPASAPRTPDAAPRRFDLPEGPAAAMLRRFADESGLEVAFLADTVRGVETPALHAVLPPRAALDRLLQGTGLVVLADGRTGALLVARPAAARSPGRSGFAVLAAGLAALGGGLVPAQGAAPAADAVQLAAFTVTGSNIPTAADAVAAPITIISRDEIERTGVAANLLEVVQARMPSFAGSGNLGATNGNVAGGAATSGGSQLSLRNLSTLVLLDGRRLPDSGASARGGRSFVDVNQIPLAALQSM